MKKHIHFVYDFKFPNGYLQFGYDKSTIRNNFFHQLESDLIESIILPNPHNPSVLTEQSGMFADEYISTNVNWNKLGVNQIQDVLDRKHYNNTQNYFIICLEATNNSSFFEYYSNPNINFDNLFSPKLLDFFKKRQEFKLVLLDNREGSYYHDPALFTKISKWLDKNNIVGKNKVIVSTCNEKINDIPIKDNRIKTYNNDYYLYYSGKFIVECEERNNLITEDGKDYQYSLQDKIKFNKREKYFLNYNRNSGRFHRPFLINKLYNKNILDKGIVSLLKTNEFDSIINDIKNNLKDYNPDFGLDLQNEDYKTIYLNHKNWYPLVIDNENEEEVAWYHNFLSRKDEYEKTYFSIVSETNAEDIYLFITEKTLKPIMNLHPFLINGNPYTLRHLKSLGFQTFEKWWDESYDTETNFKKRILLLVEQINILCNKTHEEWIKMLEEMQPILHYNKNLLKQKYTSKKFEDNFLKQFQIELL
jgi:hypothetical protein